MASTGAADELRTLLFVSGMPAALNDVKPAGSPGCIPSKDIGYAPARLWRMSKEENLLGGIAAFLASFLAFSSGVSANLHTIKARSQRVRFSSYA